jgi:hypothetical protein
VGRRLLCGHFKAQDGVARPSPTVAMQEDPGSMVDYAAAVRARPDGGRRGPGAVWTHLVVGAEFLRDEVLVRDAVARTALRGIRRRPAGQPQSGSRMARSGSAHAPSGSRGHHLLLYLAGPWGHGLLCSDGGFRLFCRWCACRSFCGGGWLNLLRRRWTADGGMGACSSASKHKCGGPRIPLTL